MNWTMIITATLSAILSSGVVATWLKVRKDMQFKRMEQNETERLEIRSDVDKLKEQFDELYGKYLEVLKDNRIMHAEHEILKKRITELRGYRNQAMLIARLSRALNKYHKDQDVNKLITALDKELLK